MSSDLYPELLINWGPYTYDNTSRKPDSEFILHDSGHQGKSLIHHLKHALKFSTAVDILVGFFFFSGFLKLNEDLKDKNVRILVGMDLEKSLRDAISSFIEPSSIANGPDQQKAFNEHIRRLFETKYFENPKTKQAFEIFLKKLKDGSLEVRKTNNPVHAKMYIFHFQETQYDKGLVITGSSNLTAQGLEENFEVNVLLRSPNALKKASQYFNALWIDSIPILHKDNVEDFERFLQQKTWFLYPITPRKAYLKAVYEYFKTINPDRFNINPEDYGYQRLVWQQDALWQAVRALNAHRGVILGDVVGLGKSIIASMIAKYYQISTPKRFAVCVICPPLLKEQWKDYLRDFGLPTGYVYSNSIQGLEQAYKDMEKLEDYEIIFIIDEAHTFRNENTLRYKLLYETVFGYKVVLLSATPYNNRPSEVISLLKLFQAPNAPTLPYLGNLSLLAKRLDRLFEEAKRIENPNTRKRYVEAIKNRLMPIIEPILIRRTRQDLQKISRYIEALKTQNITIPQVKGPELLLTDDLGDVEYAIRKTNELLLGSNDNALQGFKGALYMPLNYLKMDKIVKYQQQVEDYFKIRFKAVKKVQEANAELIKRLLLLRFESSSYAFFVTLLRLLQRITALYNDIQKTKMVRINKQTGGIDFNSLIKEFAAQEDQELELSTEQSQNNNTIFVDINDLRESFLEDIKNDIEVLTTILKLWYQVWFNTQLNIQEIGPLVFKDPKKLLQRFVNISTLDPKARLLVDTVRQWFQKRQQEPHKYGKIVIFTEYADTAHYLAEVLNREIPEHKTLLFTADHKSKKMKKILRVNFDANYTPEDEEPLPTEEYDILVTTDVLSEGINLHKANAIINIDIPYNPSRVVQRVGRINRIKGMKYDTIYIYNYFPSYISEKHINVKNISTLKQALSNLLFGGDSPILTEEEIEQLKQYDRSRYVSKFKEAYQRLLQEELEEESWDIKHLNVYFNEIKSNPELEKELQEMPTRIKLKRKLPTRQREFLLHILQNLTSIEPNKAGEDQPVEEQPNPLNDFQYFISFIKEKDNVQFYLTQFKEPQPQDKQPTIEWEPLVLSPKEALELLEAHAQEQATYIKDELLPLTSEIIEKVRRKRQIHQNTGTTGETRTKATTVATRLGILFRRLRSSLPAKDFQYLKNVLYLTKSQGALAPKTIKQLYLKLQDLPDNPTQEQALEYLNEIKNILKPSLVARLTKQLEEDQNPEPPTIIITEQIY